MDTNKSTTTSSSDRLQQQPSAVSRVALPRQRDNIHRVQNVLLVWLDNNSDDCRDTITQLRRVMNEINTFTDTNQCVQFVETITDNKVCMIVSDVLGQHIVPRVHGMTQVDSIFILGEGKKRPEAWNKDWIKIKGVFTETSVPSAKL